MVDSKTVVRLWKIHAGCYAKTEIVFPLDPNNYQCKANAHWVNERDNFIPFLEGVNPNAKGTTAKPVEFPEDVKCLSDPVVVGMIAADQQFKKAVFGDPNYPRLMDKWVSEDENKRQREIKTKANLKSRVQGTPVKASSKVGLLLQAMEAQEGEGATLEELTAALGEPVTEAMIKARCKMLGYTYRLELDRYCLNEAPKFI